MSFSEWSNKKKKEREEEEKKSSQSSSSSTTNKEEKPSSFADWSNKKHGKTGNGNEDERNSILNSEDFEHYSQIGASVANPTWNESFAPIDLFGWKPFGDGKEIGNIVTFAEENAMKASAASGNAMRGGGTTTDHTQLVNLINQYMTDEEKLIYNYYIGKGDTEKAQEYITQLTDVFRMRQAGGMIEQADDNALELVYSGIAGVGQFASGIKNLDNYVKGGDADPTTSLQYANLEMSSNNSGIWRISNDLVNTVGNMAPSILTSMAVTAITGLPQVGEAVGSITMGASATGNAYAEMKNLGYTDSEARNYATLVGSSEALLQYLLGGIGKLGGKLSGNLVTKFVSSLDNAFLKLAVTTSIKMGSEGLEEGIQTAIEPVFKAWVTGEEFEAASLEDVLYSALLGALSAGFLDGVPSAADTVSTTINAKKNYGSQTEALLNEAGQISEYGETVNKYKNKYGEKGELSGSDINYLLEITDTNKIKSATESTLTKYGEKGNTSQLADILTKQVKGEELSRAEQKLLDQSTYGQRVANELNPDNIMSGQYATNWSEQIGTRRVNAREYNKGQNIFSEDFKNKIVTKGVPEESKYKASEDGKTTLNDQEVSIQGVESIKGGEVTLRLENGETVKASDVLFSSNHEALMYDIISRMEATPDTANQILSQFKPTSTAQASMYYTSIPLAYEYGKINYEAGLKNINMPNHLKNSVFRRGRIDAMIQVEKNMPKTDSAKKGSVKTNKKGIIYEGDYKYHEASANPLQKSSMQTIEFVNAVSNLEVHVYESKLENGKRVAYVDGKAVYANGYFKDGNKIYIDINAGQHGEGLMLDTMGHEVGHYIEINNPKDFKVIGDFLIEQYGKIGVNVQELLDKQKQKIKDRYVREKKALPSESKLNDMAYKEMVCDAMSEMFNDPKAVEKLSKLKQENRSAWETLRDAIKKILDKIKSILDQYKSEKRKVAKDAVAVEAARVRDFSADAYEKLQDLYIKAFVEADANYEAMGEKHLKNKDVLFNLRAVETHKSNLEKQYSNDASISLETLTERYNKIIGIWEKLGGELNSKFLNEWNNKVGKDRAFTVFKAQAGYKYNVELSSMCKKGVPLFEAIDTIVKEEVMKELDTKVIGKEEKEILYDLLKTNNFEIPCAICYVEQARQREGVIIDAFLNGKIEKNNAGKTTTFKLGWNEVLKAVEKEMKLNGVDYTFHAVDRSIATDKYVPADISMDEATQDAFYNALKKVANKEIARYNKAEDKNRKLVTSITPAAIKEVFKGTLPSNLKIFKVLFTEPSSRFTMESDLLYSSMTTHNLATAHNNLYSLFNSQGGVSGYKTKQGTVVYWGDILGKTWEPSKVRDEGGIRNQSNSDFQMYTLLDQVQMYVDFSAKGYYLQAYTKVLSELKLFGLSRGKINASLIPAVHVYHNADGSIDIETTRAYAGLDKNGNLLFDDIEGINHTEAFMLLEDAEYSKSIGGICIGYSDEHIRKLLDDKRVQQIIGFHDKTDDPDKRYKGAKYAKNYNGLNEAINNKDGKTVHLGFNPYVRKAEKMFTFDAKTETYKGEIEYNGKTYVADDIPKLAADLYLEMCKKKDYTPAYTDFDYHENYYKLLADFSLYDSQGHYAPHRKVAFNMPDSVPYLDINGKKKYMPTKDYIKAELEKELKVRDSISEALADKSETGLIPQFVKRVNESKANQSETKFSDRDTETVSNRTLLANALDSVAKNDIEKTKLAQYREKIALIESEQVKLSKIRAEIKELSFAKGPRDTARIKSLQFEANQAANRINTYDRQLLNLESTKALKGVLDREKAMARKKAEQMGKESLRRQKEKDAATVRELLARNYESRKKATESRNKTAMRHKIRKVVNELNQLLLHGSKERNVKLGLQEAVAAALDAINMDTVGADERVAKYNTLIAQAKDPDVIASLKETRDRIKAQGDSLGDKLKAMKEAYYGIQHGEESKNYPAYFKEEATLIEQRIQNVIDKVGNTSLRDMSLTQLDLVYDMYKMVLTTIQNANAVWKEGKALDLKDNASAVMTELEEIKELGEEGTKIGEYIRSYSWNEMTPYYAFDRIGSKTLKSFFMEAIRGQNVYANDVAEAKAFADKIRKKYGYTKWDLDKVYEFKLKDGRTFQVTLKHMLSIYAYSKREQALPHMSTGGFFFNDKSTFRKKGGIIELIRRTDSGYKIDAESLAEIKEALGDKVNYVDEMQEYLTKMGEKGNEVTRTLWGIDLFKEKVYFPLKSMSDFIKKSTETVQSVSLKNDGMTKETVPGASNPIVLEAFDDVWASHIDRMSQYHAFVIPIDNLNKIHQYGTWAGTESMAVSTMLTGRFGSAVNEYISQFIKDLNGNVVNPGAKNPLMGFLTKFKKTAVGASLSTMVQQPTAVLRAMADVNAKYFIGKPNTSKLSNQWEELKQYAPIAIIKDIGGFDAGSGVQVSRWLNTDTLRGVDKVMNTIDDVSMKGAEFFDQLGWTSIWEAVKREISATTNLKVGSEEFLKKAGERFTEVIVRTQVYDSTLSRSGYMRSKSDTMKMLTAFMGEPTLSINMIFNAIINAKRGGSKKQAVRTIGFTYASIIAASAMASLIYALRDDDDDESYLEKYMQSLGSEFISDVVLAPITSLPAVKDVASIFQGWDVERTDVAIFKDIKDAFDGLSSETKSPYRKIEDFAGAIAAAFGIPLKNVLRTGREIYNAFSAITDDISGGDAGGAFVEGITGKEQSKPTQLYKAIINGDDARLERIKSSYKDESSYLSAVKSALRANDSRIHDAAQALLDGNISEYGLITYEIIGEGHFSQDIVVDAINAEMNAIKKDQSEPTESTDDKDEATSIYKPDHINIAFDNGDTDLALSIIDELVEMKMANGMDEKKAKSSIRSSMTSYWKPLYKQAYASGNTSEVRRIKQILYKSGLYGSAPEVIKDVNSWLKN